MDLSAASLPSGVALMETSFPAAGPGNRVKDHHLVHLHFTFTGKGGLQLPEMEDGCKKLFSQFIAHFINS